MTGIQLKQNRTKDTYLGHSVQSDQKNIQLSPSTNPLLLQPQTLGNQAMQRYAQSCPLELSSASICPFGGVCHACPARVQARLKISQPGDKYEQEADRIADEVLLMPDPAPADRSPIYGASAITHIQRQCPECEKELQRQPEEEEEEKLLQAKEMPGQTPNINSGVEANIDSVLSGGQPLPESVRTYFEPRFGYDFNQVRIHTEPRAAESTRAMHAQAYTLGHNIVFGNGHYSPETSAGKHLLAHELAHVIQQDGSTPAVIQRSCGHSAIGEPSGCTGLGGMLLGIPSGFV